MSFHCEFIAGEDMKAFIRGDSAVWVFYIIVNIFLLRAAIKNPKSIFIPTWLVTSFYSFMITLVLRDYVFIRIRTDAMSQCSIEGSPWGVILSGFVHAGAYNISLNVTISYSFSDSNFN